MNGDSGFPAGIRPAIQSTSNPNTFRSRNTSSPHKAAISRRPSLEVPMLSASSANNHTLFSFGRNGASGPSRDTIDSLDFLPSVSFDDLQSSLESAHSDFKLTQFPSPTGQGSILGDQGFADNSNNMVERSNLARNGGTARVVTQQQQSQQPHQPSQQQQQPQPPQQQSQQQPPQQQQQQQSGPRTSRSGSIFRRPSISNRQSSTSSTVSSASGGVLNAPTAPAAMRPRRQSHYPPVSNSNIAKPPRKSVGPGVYDSDHENRNVQRRRPSLASLSDKAGATASTRSSIDGGSRVGGGIGGGGEIPRYMTSSRASRSRSIQPHRQNQPSISAIENTNHTNHSNSTNNGPGGAANTNNTNNTSNNNTSNNNNTSSYNNSVLTPEQSRISASFSRSPRPSGGPSSNQSSGGKRASAMPGVPHATGLGARTISPTDTRRMKRLSLHHSRNQSRVSELPPPPPAATEVRSPSRSPSMLPRKTSTPSSSRTSPDITRKSYSSGLSIGSTNSTTNTVRTSTGSVQPRIPQLTGSRLPAPKSLHSHNTGTSNNGNNNNNNNDDEEDVPPVPAIPKVYESPKDSPAEMSFLGKRKSNLGLDTSSIHSASTGSLSGLGSSETLSKPQKKKHTSRKSVANPTKVDPEKKSSGPHSKKHLQPLRLPPITLGPLSTPTTSKIAALQDREDSDGNFSPIPARHAAKTPTTPMTASKSMYFTRHRADEKNEYASLRSSSSIHHLHSSTPSGPDPTSSSDSITVPDAKESQRSGMSPFLSSSLPKGGLESTFVKRSKTGGDITLPLDSTVDFPVQRKPSGPRARKSRNKSIGKAASPLSSPEEPPTPSSMSSLRRKLSLSWKRSASKNSTNQPLGDKTDSNNHAKQESMMPPPRLPASATVSSFSSKAASPTPSAKSGGTGSYLDSRRRKSSTSSLNAIIAQDRNRGDNAAGSKKESNLDTVVERTKPSHSSSVTHRVPKPKSSMNSVRQLDVWSAELDKDDLVAEEEMKKLGSRRRETELAARTLDALRKRATPKERVSPQEAIRIAMLNIYERGEIVDYKDIYFCGTQNAAKVVGDLNSSMPNFGYDDDRGDYTIVSGDHISYRYEIIDVLGKGSFGQVVRCIDHKTGVLVAVKIIRNKKRFHQQALVEVNILQKLREWDPKNKHSMVNFTHSFYFRGHLCISTELLDMNLYEFIKFNGFRGFSLKLIRRFTKQMLNSLNLLKQHKVIHCDLKPENILLRHPLHSEIKVIDFGSSCFENEKVYTYIQSRFYRSPEVILGMTYGMPIDMWSLGCILAELYTGVPIFPGENEQEQLACIMEVFGPPEKHLIEKSTRKKLFFDSMGKPRLTVSSKGRRRRPSSKTLQHVLKCDDEAFLDFLGRCLRWDPDRRMKPDEAIRHEFITGQKTSVPVPRSAVRDPSPVKRPNAVSASRPLPEPPGGTKTNGAVRPSYSGLTTGIGGSSPIKTASSVRRVSGVGATAGNNLTAPSGAAKRTSTGPNLGFIPSSTTSNLPRAAVRNVSGKQDTATTGATVAMGRRA